MSECVLQYYSFSYSLVVFFVQSRHTLRSSSFLTLLLSLSLSLLGFAASTNSIFTIKYFIYAVVYVESTMRRLVARLMLWNGFVSWVKNVCGIVAYSRENILFFSYFFLPSPHTFQSPFLYHSDNIKSTSSLVFCLSLSVGQCVCCITIFEYICASVES